MQGMMNGLVFRGDRTVEILQFPIPAPGPGQVLIQMKTAAICGSDLHTYRRPKAEFTDRAPWITGHEPAGIVAEVGPECHRIHVGDRVTIYHYLACGHCRYCLNGMYQWCLERRGLGQPNAAGPDADYMVVDERNCLSLPPELSFDDGAMIACIAGTAYASLRKLQVNGEDTVVVFGQGPVGLMNVIIAKAMGARIIGVDVMDERLQLGGVLGANMVLNPQQVPIVEAIRDVTGGLGADAACETSGSAIAQANLIDALRPGGKAVFVGFGAQGPSITVSSFIGKQLQLFGSFVMPIGYYWDLVEFIIEHQLSHKYQQMITHRFAITEGAEAFRVADSARAGKVVFSWE
ncbi:MAG: alcohol dehydrogenase catalytic domain-containing protein [Chloroflexi bacterium]|nr:alcohol dehydrogenase catalytic domain-containing protein [Chloroflexota bacterium]